MTALKTVVVTPRLPHKVLATIVQSKAQVIKKALLQAYSKAEYRYKLDRGIYPMSPYWREAQHSPSSLGRRSSSQQPPGVITTACSLGDPCGLGLGWDKVHTQGNLLPIRD